MKFALNHSVAPDRRFRDFARMARGLGLTDVEIRNDLPGVEIANGTSADDLRREAAELGVRIAAINALQRFDDWNETRADEARLLAGFAGLRSRGAGFVPGERRRRPARCGAACGRLAAGSERTGADP